MKIRIATRRSNLALVQTRWVAARIREHFPEIEVEEVQVETKGDQILDKPLAEIGGKGLFITEVEACLLDGRAEIAVHSMKDVPAELAEGMDIVCIPEREDPRDLLVSATGEELDALEAGTKIGTGSLRRSCQLRNRRPDLAYGNIRGNVETRLRKMDEGQFGAIILAAAGMRRLGYDEKRPHWVIPTDISIPAVGQGTLAIEARTDATEVIEVLQKLEHRETRLVTTAERAFLGRIEGSCKIPIAGFAQLGDGGRRLTMDAMVGSLDGETILSAATDIYFEDRAHEAQLKEARALGIQMADQLLEQGARKLITDAITEMERQQVQSNGKGRW